MATEIALGSLKAHERRPPILPLRAWNLLLRLARRKPLGFLGFLFVAGMIVLAIAPGLVAPHSPSQTNVAPRFQSYCLGPQGSLLCPSRQEISPLTGQTRTFTGSLSEPLGTDQLGRDIFSRIVWGTRVSAYVGFGPWMVQATIALGGIILTESALSFLGFGVTNPNQPSWGAMLQLGQTVAAEHPMQAVWPGLAIALAVFSFNMFGDALRDLLDPRLRGGGGTFN